MRSNAASTAGPAPGHPYRASDLVVGVDLDAERTAVLARAVFGDDGRLRRVRPWPGLVRRVGDRCFAVVAVEQAPVRVGDYAPAPVRRRPVGHHAEHLLRLDLVRVDDAPVAPVVAKVEGVAELFAQIQHLAEGYRVGVQLPLRVDVVAVAELGHRLAELRQVELVQVAAVPPGERIVDGLGEGVEGVRRGHREHPARAGPQVTGRPAAEQFHPHRPPAAILPSWTHTPDSAPRPAAWSQRIAGRIYTPRQTRHVVSWQLAEQAEAPTTYPEGQRSGRSAPRPPADPAARGDVFTDGRLYAHDRRTPRLVLADSAVFSSACFGSGRADLTLQSPPRSEESVRPNRRACRSSINCGSGVFH